jgi:hypothetical protein
MKEGTRGMKQRERVGGEVVVRRQEVFVGELINFRYFEASQQE